MRVRVNREWERLFGYTAAEMRALMLREGMSGVYRLARVDSVQVAHRVGVEALLTGHTDYRFWSVVVTKFLSEVHCLAHVRIQLTADGTFSGFQQSWCPLPDPRPPTLRQIQL